MYSAKLAYGFKINDKQADKFLAPPFSLPRELDIMVGGSYEETKFYFVVIEKSLATNLLYCEPTQLIRNVMEVQDNWNTILFEFAQKNNIHPIISWWLVVDEG